MNIDCVLCYNKMTGQHGDNSVTPCGHMFHGSCVKRWLQRSQSCPYCRAIISPSSLYPLYVTSSTRDSTSSTSGEPSSAHLKAEIRQLKSQLAKSLALKTASDSQVSALIEVISANDCIADHLTGSLIRDSYAKHQDQVFDLENGNGIAAERNGRL